MPTNTVSDYYRPMFGVGDLVYIKQHICGEWKAGKQIISVLRIKCKE